MYNIIQTIKLTNSGKCFIRTFGLTGKQTTERFYLEDYLPLETWCKAIHENVKRVEIKCIKSFFFKKFLTNE